MIRPYNRALGAKGKQANRAFGPWKYTPIPACGGTSTRRGKSALRSAFVLISISKHSAAKICPSGEDAAAGGRRGAFPSPAGRLYGFPCPQGGLPVFHSPTRAIVWFYHTGAFYKLKAPTTTFAPQARQTLEPSAPSEPSAVKRLSPFSPAPFPYLC